MLKIYAETYGCWLNKADTDILLQAFLDSGFTLVRDPENADVVLLNTCAVRGDSEIRQLKRMRELYSKYGDEKIYVIAGCLAKVRVAEIRRIFNQKCIIVDPNSVENAEEVVQAVIRREYRIFLSDDRPMRILPRFMPEIHGHVYIVPVQVGCLCSCTFCVTRFAREVKGRVKSYPIDLIVEHVKKAVQKGVREIYLTGQDVATYGFDRGYTLVELLEKILRDVEGVYFIRIGMSEPEAFMKIADQIIDVVKSDERVYRYFHLPVQSGSDRVLQLMRRKYTVDEYVELVQKIRREIPESTIVTDMIVGFPGESEEDFQLSLRLIELLKFDKVHVARFSPRPYTEAAVMDDQVPDAEKKRRSRIMAELANKVALERNLMFVGKTLRGVVSAPEPKGGGCVVRVLNYKPVIVKSMSRELMSSVVNVTITSASYTSLFADKYEVVVGPTIRPSREVVALLEEDTS